MKRIVFSAVILADGQKIAPALVTYSDDNTVESVEPFITETPQTTFCGKELDLRCSAQKTD